MKELNKVAAEKSMCKRRRLIQENPPHPNQSKEELLKENLKKELENYFEILKKGCFVKNIKPEEFWIQNRESFLLLSQFAFFIVQFQLHRLH